MEECLEWRQYKMKYEEFEDARETLSKCFYYLRCVNKHTSISLLEWSFKHAFVASIVLNVINPYPLEDLSLFRQIHKSRIVP